jgi:hypothetical protein
MRVGQSACRKSAVKLPRSEGAVVDDEKVRDYLLSSTHPIGRLKATFFVGLGYREADWVRLHKDLLDLAQLDTATQGRFTRYGNKYEVRGTLTGPSGRSAVVLTVWMVKHGEDFPRFITAFPKDEP